MKILRNLLGLNDWALHERATKTDDEIRKVKSSLQEKMTALETRQNEQATNILNRRDSDLIMAQWAGAMAILRDKK